MWIIITIAAATFQILRTARQHELRGALPTTAAGFVRYAYGAPLAIALSFIIFVLLDHEVPGIPARFWTITTSAGVCQIIGTIALLAAFKQRDFAVGTVYAKTEVLIVALLGLIGLETALTGIGWIGTAVVTAGVIWLASKGSIDVLLQNSGDPAAILGLVAAAGFAGAAVGIGAASRSLTGAGAFDRAVFTLTVLLVLQLVLNAAWIAATDRTQLAAVGRAWRPAMWVGLFSLLGSIAWAWGFTLESAAKVRTLGQIELLIAFAIARLQLKETHTAQEYAGSALVLLGVVIVTVAG